MKNYKNLFFYNFISNHIYIMFRSTSRRIHKKGMRRTRHRRGGKYNKRVRGGDDLAGGDDLSGGDVEEEHSIDFEGGDDLSGGRRRHHRKTKRHHRKTKRR